MPFRVFCLTLAFLVSLPVFATAQKPVHFIDSNSRSTFFTPDTVIIGEPFYVVAQITGPALSYIVNFANDDSDYYGTLNDAQAIDTIAVPYVFTLPGSNIVTVSARDRHGNLIGADTMRIVATFGNIASQIIGEWFVIGFFDLGGNGHVASGDTLTFFSNGRYSGSLGLPHSAQHGAWAADPYGRVTSDSSKKVSSVYLGDTLVLSSPYPDSFHDQPILQIFFKSAQASIIGDMSPSIPFSIFPNPISSNAIISFSLPKAELISIYVSDITGHRWPILQSQRFEPGDHTIPWDVAELSPGAYLCELLDAGLLSSKSVIVLR